MAKIALLIGVSEYEPGLNPLPAAVRDVEALRSVLLNPAIGGFAESDVVLLKNPDRQTMEEAIETLFMGRSKDDLLLLFFSGHGIKDDAGQLFLVTRGTRKTHQGDLIRSTAVQSNFIQDNMSRSRSKRQVVILDSCFSGAFAEGLSAKDDGTIDVRSQLGGEGRAVLTSSSSTQYSFEYKGSELSLYTRFLIEGIETGAADIDEDEVVSIDELHEYVSRKVKEIRPELKPEIFAIREGFKIRLTKVPAIDPQQKYRREVAKFIDQDQYKISKIGEIVLNILGNQLSLSSETRNEIECDVLRPYLQKMENLQQYKLSFVSAIEREFPLNTQTQKDLEELSKILYLSIKDVSRIEEESIKEIGDQRKIYQQNLQLYEKEFLQAICRNDRLSESVRENLKKLQLHLGLNDEDITSIELHIVTDLYKNDELQKSIENMQGPNQNFEDLPPDKWYKTENSKQTILSRFLHFLFDEK
jgi:hypothetical protein